MTTFAVIAVSVLIALAAHEAAHAVVMHRLGVRINQAGLGLPLSPVLTIPPRGRRTFALTLSPWLVAAYVHPHPDDHKKLEQLPYRDQAWAYNAGIVVNLTLGLAVGGVMRLVLDGTVRGLVMLGLAAAVWFGQRLVCAYVLPALAVPVLVWVGYLLAQTWSQGETGAGFSSMGGLLEPGVAGAVGMFAALNLSIGVMNMLPLMPLDNSKVLEMVLRQWMRMRGRALTAYRTSGAIAMLGLLLLSFGTDAWVLARGVFA